jgi:hypothetical protein
MIEQYNYDDSEFERVGNVKEEEMKLRGFDFITNFTPERESFYHKAAEIHNL